MKFIICFYLAKKIKIAVNGYKYLNINEISLFTMYVVGVSVIFVRINFGSRLPKWQMIDLGVSDILYNILFVYT